MSGTNLFSIRSYSVPADADDVADGSVDGIPTLAGKAAANDIGAAAGATTAEQLQGLVGVVPICYGEMYIYENTTAETIDTVDVYKAARNFTAGTLEEFTFEAGATGAITAFADYAGTVTGTTLVTSATHGLLNGNIVTILGTTNYNGAYAITKVDANTYYIVKAFVADDATGNWYKPNSLRASANAAGVYRIEVSLTGEASAGGKLYRFCLNVGPLPTENIVTERFMGTGGDFRVVMANGILTLAAGDDVWLSFKQITVGATNLVLRHVNVNLMRMHG